jgi:DNA modification methylase
VSNIQLYNDSCDNILPTLDLSNAIIVSDPPFNIGYHYDNYDDNMIEDAYYEWIGNIFSLCPSAIVHYPESLYKLAFQMGKFPERVVSWVYNSNTAKQHRDIAFFGVKPNFNQVRQPYKNPNDKRIKERIARGITGSKLYDWWNINQVKNVSKGKNGINHPCVMPLEVMKNIVGILPKGKVIVDPFMGSGTTGVACKELGYDFIGIELDENYFKLAEERIKNI